MIINNKYAYFFDDIKKCARISIELSANDRRYIPGIKYLEDHFLFDLPIYRNFRISRFLADNIPENSKVLDWGCGYGDASFMLRSLRPDLDIISYDVLSSPPWETLAGKENLNKIVDNNEDRLPFEAGCFDAIFGIGVLEHVNNQENSLKEIYRILKPGGLFYIFLYPNRFSYTERFQKTIGHPCHDKPLSMEELEKRVTDPGFTVEAKGYQLTLPIILSRFPFFVRYLYNLFGNAIMAMNDIFEKIPVLNKLSSNLMVICRKK